MASVFYCTPATPWDGVSTPVQHLSAYETGEQEDGYPGGDYVLMECRDCCHRWRMELPQ